MTSDITARRGDGKEGTWDSRGRDQREGLRPGEPPGLLGPPALGGGRWAWFPEGLQDGRQSPPLVLRPLASGTREDTLCGFGLCSVSVCDGRGHWQTPTHSPESLPCWSPVSGWPVSRNTWGTDCSDPSGDPGLPLCPESVDTQLRTGQRRVLSLTPDPGSPSVMSLAAGPTPLQVRSPLGLEQSGPQSGELSPARSPGEAAGPHAPDCPAVGGITGLVTCQ